MECPTIPPKVSEWLELELIVRAERGKRLCHEIISSGKKEAEEVKETSGNRDSRICLKQCMSDPYKAIERAI